MARNGALIIPSFAVERTQELLVDIAGLMESGAVPQAPIFIDSPLATKATAVFETHAHALENGDALVRALHAHHVHFTESVEQSKAIGRFRGFHIVIAASGMCEAGRIRHHLKNWLWRDEGTVLLVGFQAQGTLGRILHDGATRVRIQGEEIQVRAQIRSLDVYSGHADPRASALLTIRIMAQVRACIGAAPKGRGEQNSGADRHRLVTDQARSCSPGAQGRVREQAAGR